MDIFGWRACIFTTVYLNGKFSHNVVDYRTVHGDNYEQALSGVTIELPKKIILKDGYTIETYQWLHDLQYLGKEVRRVIIEYEKEIE